MIFIKKYRSYKKSDYKMLAYDNTIGFLLVIPIFWYREKVKEDWEK